MNSTFILNCGAGAAVAAIPALEKYSKLNPKDDFRLLIHSWSSIFENHPLLRNRTFDVTSKGVFEKYAKNYKLKMLEPYLVNRYYNGKLHLSEAFDECVNNTTDHSDLQPPKLYIDKVERDSIRRIIDNYNKDKKKTIVFQPYGSGMVMKNNRPFDHSGRSIDVDDYLYIVNKLSEDYLVFFFGTNELRHPGDIVTPNLNSWEKDLRFFMSLIAECDYFLGADSIGQHVAYAFDKPGAVVLGGTLDKNVCYPDHFKIFRNGVQPTYNPIRIAHADSDAADINNQKTMVFTKPQLDEICNYVKSSL